MDIGVDISLYPLAEEFAPMIHDFINRLRARPTLKVVAGSLRTQVFGAHAQVFEALRGELRATLEARALVAGKAAFVLKVLGPL